jgi:acetylornithine/N-succinyldiaminopimelate aminotransferase
MALSLIISPLSLRAFTTMTATASAPAAFDPAAFDKVVMGTYGRFKLAVARGEGCYLWDTDGNKHLDFAAGIATCCLGHGDMSLADAVYNQMKTVHHVSNLYYIPQQGQLATRLVEGSCADRAFFCNSGAEANEAAIKLARKHAHEVLEIDEPLILTAKNSFHGRTLATITATGQPKYHKGFYPLVPGFDYVTYNDVDELRSMVKDARGGLLGKGKSRLAAIMLEPLQVRGVGRRTLPLTLTPEPDSRPDAPTPSPAHPPSHCRARVASRPRRRSSSLRRVSCATRRARCHVKSSHRKHGPEEVSP